MKFITLFLLVLNFVAGAQSPSIRARMVADSLSEKLQLSSEQKDKILELNMSTIKWIDEAIKNRTTAVEGHSYDPKGKLLEIEKAWTNSAMKIIKRKKLKKYLAKQKKAGKKEKISEIKGEAYSSEFVIQKDNLGFTWLIAY